MISTVTLINICHSHVPTIYPTPTASQLRSGIWWSLTFLLFCVCLSVL